MDSGLLRGAAEDSDLLPAVVAVVARHPVPVVVAAEADHVGEEADQDSWFGHQYKYERPGINRVFPFFPGRTG